MNSSEQVEFFAHNGYVVTRQLFTPEEVAHYRDHFMELRARGNYPHDLDGVDMTTGDPLKKYPRMLHMHHWDETTRRWLLDDRLRTCLTALLGAEPYAVQSMLYFKPPGARGQAPHQDNFYLAVEPGTCAAAWLALDACDEANGCMRVVPGSHRWPLLCTERADTKISFTDVAVPLPEGVALEAVEMEAGDVLYFHGNLVHGSFPNHTTDRFRRSLIGHYVEAGTQQITEIDKLVLRFDGRTVEVATTEHAPAGGRCGQWVEEDGTPVIEMSGVEVSSPTARE